MGDLIRFEILPRLQKIAQKHGSFDLIRFEIYFIKVVQRILEING